MLKKDTDSLSMQCDNSTTSTIMPTTIQTRSANNKQVDYGGDNGDNNDEDEDDDLFL